jgi:hypothetical protein
MMKTTLFGVIIATVMIFGVFAVSQNQALSEEMKDTSDHEQESGIHLVDTETISLKGKLASGDFKLLMDITGFISVSGHVAMKVPCGPDGEQLLTIVSGVAPNVVPMDMAYVAPLSGPPNSCVYHGEIPEGITDIALMNTSDDAIWFVGQGSAGYSVTITIHGVEAEPEEHM